MFRIFMFVLALMTMLAMILAITFVVILALMSMFAMILVLTFIFVIMVLVIAFIITMWIVCKLWKTK